MTQFAAGNLRVQTCVVINNYGSDFLCMANKMALVFSRFSEVWKQHSKTNGSEIREKESIKSIYDFLKLKPRKC